MRWGGVVGVGVLAYIPESVDANTQIDVCALGVPEQMASFSPV